MRDQHVYLNGVSLESVHPQILLQHIDESAPEIDIKTHDLAGTQGQMVTSHKLTKREVSIEFGVRERLDFARRAEVIGAAAAWAGHGGWLSLSSRPGLRLYVVPEELPGVGKLREWTESSTIRLTAYAWPLWTEEAPSAAALSLTAGTAGSTYISAAGTWETNLEAVITPASTLTEITIAANGQQMVLDGISVAQDVPLSIRWDELHLLRIEANDTGLLRYRSGDDLTLTPGRHQVTVTADADCAVKLMARGCWL